MRHNIFKAAIAGIKGPHGVRCVPEPTLTVNMSVQSNNHGIKLERTKVPCNCCTSVCLRSVGCNGYNTSIKYMSFCLLTNVGPIANVGQQGPCLLSMASAAAEFVPY